MCVSFVNFVLLVRWFCIGLLFIGSLCSDATVRELNKWHCLEGVETQKAHDETSGEMIECDDNNVREFNDETSTPTTSGQENMSC